jgi:nucleoside-diphosphate-sugar epimerase
VRALVTGGGGFLGRAIVERLLAAGLSVRSLARGEHAELASLGVECVRGDVADASAARAAARGVELVFHTAALAGVWGARADYWRTNVDGTRALLEACRAEGVPRFVFTSSPSVCFDGRDHLRARNDLPYARKFLAHYPASKAEAERAVLAANGTGGLATCALRPHLIVGPRDPHLLPRLVERARARRLFVVGDGTNEVSLTWIDNAAEAHVLAGLHLSPSAAHAGRAYFVAQETPVRLWEWIAAFLRAIGAPPPRGPIGARTAYAAGAACELVWRALRKHGEPPITRFTALQLSTSHSYDMTPAREDFGYRELVSMQEATERLIAHWTERGSATAQRKVRSTRS